jgi:hypothetical protein
MNYKSISVFVALLFCFSPLMFAQEANDILDKISSAIKQSDATKLAEYFSTTIDLEAGSSDGSYSKKQAEMIMKDFFKNTPVKSFFSNHKGASDDGSKYMIGTYKSTNGDSFRVYILLKKMENKLKINQLQFDKE